MGERDIAQSTSPSSPAVSVQRRAVVISDGRGGVITLDLGCREMHLLVDAGRCLLQGAAPAGASLIKVCAGSEVYVLSQRQLDGVDHLRIANLYDPSEQVVLAHDLAHMTVALVERLLAS